MSEQQGKQKRNLVIIGALVGVAVVAAAAIILLSGSGTTLAGEIDYASLPQSRAEDGGFVLGDLNAPVTVVEFADFTCPHCQDYKETMDRFVRDFVVSGKAKLEYRMLRTTGSPYGDFAAQLAECADTVKPGSFWTVHDRLFDLAGAGLYDNMGPDVARILHVDYAKLLECTSNARQFVADSTVGEQAGVQGTPAVMIRVKDGPLQWIVLNGQTYSRGGVGYGELAAVVSQVQ